MTLIRSSDYFRKHVGVVGGKFELSFGDDDFEIECLSLTVDMIAELKEKDEYDHMLDFAADRGVAFGKVRGFGSASLQELAQGLWEYEDFNVDAEPCIKMQFGEYVCDISGLQDFLAEVLEKQKDEEAEAERRTIDGDGITEETLGRSLGDLEADANQAP